MRYLYLTIIYQYPGLFSGCLFVAGNVAEVASLASSQKAAILLDKEGKSLSIEAGKAELPAKFAQLLRL